MREQKGGRGLSDGIPSGSTAARTKEDVRAYLTRAAFPSPYCQHGRCRGNCKIGKGNGAHSIVINH